MSRNHRWAGIALLACAFAAWAPVPVLSATTATQNQRIKTIRLVETGVAGIVGVVPGSTGDVADGAGRGLPRPGEAIQLASWDAFVATFGAPPGPFRGGRESANTQAHRHFAEAVRGFFANGGRRAWVARVSDASALANPGAPLSGLSRTDIDLVLVPGATTAAQHEALIDHAEAAGDRVAILDGRVAGRRVSAADVLATNRNSVRATVVFPRIRTSEAGIDPIPASGHVAGVIAGNDANRGVHKAPAPIDVNGATGLERILSNTEVGDLNPGGILVLRPVGGTYGAQTWGGRTLGGPTSGPFRYLNVRRFADQLTESIARGTRGMSCEDTLPLIDILLRDAWRRGALQGSKAEQAWFSRCPRGAREPQVGVAILRAEEFIVLGAD